VAAYDHVLGADPDRPGGWSGPYTYRHPFFEPFVLFSFLAAAAPGLAFATSVIVLPQRQAALVAKQAATLDVLCGGRLRLGVGLGWNEVEFVALDQDFHTRGRRMEEQVEIIRRLWTEPLVNFTGRWHTVPGAGLNPMPVQRPIPVWFGGHAERALRRAARLGDGWMPNSRTPEDALPYLVQLDSFLAEAGRSRKDFGLEARVPYGDGQASTWQALHQGWADQGATHMALNTMGTGFSTPKEHLLAVESFAHAIGM
jgi:probable F420-dependent oxidoreductase